MPFGFLEGYRVLDVSQFVPGPFAALLLADLGAEVIKIEPPRPGSKSGDPMNDLGDKDPDGLSPFYKVMNGGKTVVSIDLKDEAGKAAFLALVDAADVLVESYRPGVLDRLGIGPDVLRKRNKGLVHCALSGFGQTGPYRLRAGHDVNYMSLGGGLIGSGTVERPIIQAPPVSDYGSSVQAALSTVAALLGRARTGEGAYIDMSLTETVLSWQSVNLMGQARGAWVPGHGTGFLAGGVACYQIYRTADGRFFSLGAIEHKFWENFSNAVGHPEWISRQWEAAPQTDLIAAVQAVVAEQPLAHWNATLDDVDCCYHELVAFDEIAGHPQVEARKNIQQDSDGIIQSLYPAWVDGNPPPRRAPLRHADAADILAKWQGAAAKAG